MLPPQTYQSQLPQPIDEQHINTPYLCTSSATFKSRIILHPSDRSAQAIFLLATFERLDSFSYRLLCLVPSDSIQSSPHHNRAPHS
jgi:hypothetical protein